MRLAKVEDENSSLVVEVFAIKEAIEGYIKVGFISDSNMAIEAIKSTQNDLPLEIYPPVQTTKEKVNEFALVWFKAIHRMLNIHLQGN